MALDNVIVGEPITADTMNVLVNHFNSTNSRDVRTVSGTWQVPSGVQKFKVTLVGGGGGGGMGTATSDGENMVDAFGATGGHAQMISAIFTGHDEGTTFTITVGAGGAGGVIGVNSGNGGVGGNSSFGPTLVSNGGPGGPGTGGIAGYGSATFPGGAPSIYHINELYIHSIFSNRQIGWGRGGEPGFGFGGSGFQGRPGLVIIEW